MAINQQRINWIRQVRLPELRTRVANNTTERDRTNRNLDTLTTGRDNLKNLLNNTSDVPNHIRNSPGQVVPATRFQGNNRTNMSNRLSELRQAISSQRKIHNSNMTALNSKISSLTTTRDNLSGAISRDQGEISQLTWELNQAGIFI
ncbi:MAG: hypothetical protein FWG67_01505 [Defluviitaleaceae bacterium]|nr:hypothetical protein [Defluviitaleaceae bacterium]